jgi:hypothetical protein
MILIILKVIPVMDTNAGLIQQELIQAQVLVWTRLDYRKKLFKNSDSQISNQRDYSARRLIGSQIIESAAYCNQIFLVQFCLNGKQNTSDNLIIWLLF